MITIDIKRLNIRKGFKILDIGCGDGRHTGAVYELDGVTAIGADINFNDLTKAGERLRFHDEIGACGDGSWSFTVSDITRLPFKDNEFDLVICSEVLEHVPEEKKAIREIIRVLKPGCNLAVSVPRYVPEKICWLLSEEYHSVEHGHIRIYKTRELVRRLEKEGVKKWGGHFAHSLHAPYWWLKCLVGPSREDSLPVNLYHRFLTWDIMNKPFITALIDRLLNPFIGKSVVIYLKKTAR